MNIKDEHTSRLWTFIMKGEIMAFELDDDEMIATRINNKVASWKEVEEYIEKYYVKKDKIKEKIEELNKRIDYLDKELAEAYIQREKLGTETELDANEQYIYSMELERSIRHTEKYAYLKLLEGE